MDTWAKPLIMVRPGLDSDHARFLVHVLSVLLDDMGRVARERAAKLGEDSVPGGPGYAQACLRTLMESILLGPADA
jgi:hypothetical protein